MSTITKLRPILKHHGEGDQFGGMGVTITQKTIGSETEGQWLTLEFEVPPNFAGPPPHWHKVTTEIFYVLGGELTLEVDGNSLQTGKGGYAFVPPGTVHRYSNPTDAPAKFLLITSPAGLENYFAELTELMKEESEWPPKDMSKVKSLMAKYDTFDPPVTN